MNGDAAPGPCVAAVGTFDGFHLGHQAIAARVLSEARHSGLESCIFTFDRHPLSVIAPERAPQRAYPADSSAKLMSDYGISRIVTLAFTPSLRHLTAEDFMRKLHDEFGVGTLVMGYDNTFGSDRLATPSEYIEAGRRAGIRVVWVDAIDVAGGLRPSSSALRHAVKDGKIALYRSLSGHYPMLQGTVVPGKQNGRKIGIPTMNIAVEGLCVPPAGVYAARYIPSQGTPLPAVLNIGTNPTISSDNPCTIELHVPDYNLGDMYGTVIRFEILERLRSEQRFSSLEELRAAIKNDIKQAKKIMPS